MNPYLSVSLGKNGIMISVEHQSKVVFDGKNYFVNCDGKRHESFAKNNPSQKLCSWDCSCNKSRTVNRDHNEIARSFYEDTYGGKWTGD